ncbi:MAG: 4-(cytidine 5'-diphospho)-2-C-methyl-D-erythritol kinase [Pseudomonadota bacterium]|nr:4-(cytidine 5'-diphospho)-2-C-methyl-D-erythritol kinase [Pseudomonadota bacterium]
MTRTAPAKINLFLHVTGRRPDTYHLLQSLVVFAGFGDTLTATAVAGDTLDLTVSGEFAAAIDVPPERNLVLRAAHVLRDAAGIRAGAALHLDKALPVAAGIGGGSADAAAALQALAALWQVPAGAVDLPALALGLGADVPSCLAARPVMMEGIGERLTPTRIPDGLGVLLANPRLPLPTPAIFADYRVNEGFSPDTDLSVLAAGPGRADWFRQVGGLRNDLERSARRICPAVAGVVDALSALPGARLARMSGSGATCFALFDTARAATDAASMLRRDHPGWWTGAGPLLA